ncbi:hypothetical protein CFP65_1710 [Kitasatospora sp. MMS16-BH015]|uniref:DUF402 domain-containing protein n=1 Tax=Kitasatospora sp. MMS16-BH015 TaxID=2018025 RepID=UPI000CA1C21D|nr:DUF402 domain-containing protein [Kitasatospora sp. MMS16-BH015]AUG76590.1 hypothetical protein CFP65_1710 [Kitasatospora sp. MMS16-BH015]
MENDERVTVVRDGRLVAAGLRRGSVVAYDWGFEQGGAAYLQRTFVLLAEGMQIDQPVAFPAAQQGWWYCDLIGLEWAGPGSGEVRTSDRWIDVIVGPPDQPYRLLDLDEYGEALADGRLGPAEAAEGLRRVQRFLDRRLNRRHEVAPGWPEFPPPEVEELLGVELPQDWRFVE